MSTKEEAYEYLSRGWSCFPLLKKSKQPSVKWARYYESRASEQEVESWAADGNLAIATGKLSGLVVVDFDTYKGAKPEEFLRRYPTDCLVETGTGGFHAYYRYPENEEVRNAAGFLPGVDIRAEGGYVVAPPSIHPNGNPYRWVSKGTPAALPDVVRHKAREQSQNAPGWVSELLEGVGTGRRDDVCAKLAGWCSHKGMGKGEAVAILTLWNQKNSPPLHASDIQKTVDSVYRTDAKRLERKTQTSLMQEVKPSSEFELHSFGDYMAEFADAEMPWIIPDWLPSRTICFAISPPGTYKTWTVLDLAISVATGTSFLGQYPVHEKGPVILIQQEDYHGSTVDRLSVICHERFQIGAHVVGDEVEVSTPPEIPIFVHTERRLKFDDKTVMKAFTEQIEKIKPKLVIIDPLYSATSTDDFMTRAAEHLLFLKSLRDEHGTSFLICHHTKKSGDDKSRDRLWGSQFLNAALETGWQLSLAGDQCVKFVRHFKAAANPTEVVIKWDIDTSPDASYKYRPRILDKEEQEDEGIDVAPKSMMTATPVKKPAWKLILDLLGDHPDQWFLQTDMVKEFGLKQSTISEALTKLLKMSAVVKNDKKYRMTTRSANLHKNGKLVGE